MTALAGRRRRSTVVAAGAIVATIAAAVVLGIVGGLTLYHSTEGADASDDRPEVMFPDTPTGLLAAVDDDGRLASLAVFVARPSRSGGSVVTVPVSADASAGDGQERLPLAETADLSGVESVPREVEILLGLTIDAFEVADRARVEELLQAAGEIEVDLPDDVTDADGDVVAEEGTQTLDPMTAAAILVARDPSVPASDQYAAANAVWAGVAEAVGDGIGADAGDPEGLGGVVAQAMAGPLASRGLSWSPVPESKNPREVDVVALDRAELALVFAQIAPGKMAAPNPALTFRIESPFAEEDLETAGVTAGEVVYRVISELLFVRSNVLSVDTTPGEVPATTTISVADESLLNGVEGVDVFLGEVDAQVADERIVGVDAVIRLGASYLDSLAAGGDD